VEDKRSVIDSDSSFSVDAMMILQRDVVSRIIFVASHNDVDSNPVNNARNVMFLTIGYLKSRVVLRQPAAFDA
jgi:hypothetical protein